jgi:uncharacterized protein YggE
MKSRWLLVIVSLLVVCMVVLTSCASGESSGGSNSNQQEGIWVTGTGEVAAVPDLVNISLGIEAQEASVAVAQAKAAEVMNLVIGALTANGIASKDIQTQYFSIQKITRWDEKTSEEITIGYRVSNVVNAKVRDIEKAGIIIDAVAAAGGDLTRINSVDFSIDDPSAYNKEAREKAMQDAMDRAEQLAELGGVTLGKPTYISESVSMPYPISPIREAGVAAATPILAGEMQVTSNVQIVFAIIE